MGTHAPTGGFMANGFLLHPKYYFEGNIIKGMASHFGTAPFYSYLMWLLLYPSPVIGVGNISGANCIIGKVAQKHLYVDLASLLLAHSIVAHKEWRFLSVDWFFYCGSGACVPGIYSDAIP